MAFNDNQRVIGRWPAREAKAPDAQKNIADLYGMPYGGWLLGGTVGRNQDIAPTKYGAAMAYRLVPPINRPVNLRADAVDSLPWQLVYNETNDDANDKVIGRSTDNVIRHPLQKAFKDARRFSKQSVIKLIQFARDLYGENFIEVINNGYRATGLKWLNPLGMTVDIRDGEVFRFLYSWLDSPDSATFFYPDEIAYDHNFNPFEDLRGQSLVQVAVDKINIYRNTNRYIEAFFRNNARPSVVVSPPGEDTFTDVERNKIRDEMRREFLGTDNAFSSMVLPVQSTITTFDQPDVSQQYNINDPVLREIYTIFGVPLAMAGDTNGTTYQNSDSVMTWFYTNTIIPAARDIARFINDEIMPLFDSTGNTRFEFDTSEFDLVSADDEVRSRIAVSNYQGGIWTKNESRVYTKQDADSKNPGGDDYFTPSKPLGEERVPGAHISKPGTGEETPATTPEDALPKDKPVDQAAEKPAPPTIPGKATQVNAEDELRAWEKKALNKGVTVAFESVHLPTPVIRMIQHRLTDDTPAAIKAVFADARVIVDERAKWTDDRLNILRLAFGARKAYTDTAEAFADELRGIIRAGQQDESTRRQFAGAMRSALRRYGLQAYRDGMEEVGHNPESLSPEELRPFKDWYDKQSGFVTNFGAEVFKVGITPGEVDTRTDMWTRVSLYEAWLLGKSVGKPQQHMKWIWNPTAEHCSDCERLHNQVHTAKEWRDNGIMPGQGTECGPGCQCALVETDDPIKGVFLLSA